MSKKGQRAPLRTRQRRVDRVLSLLRRGIPAGELDEHDWDSFRVAARIVYETEDLGAAVGRKVIRDRSEKICDWSDSIDGAITFMTWTRELAQIVTGMTYPATVPASVAALWRRHHALAKTLLAPKLPPEKRLSVLVQLGGIEVSLWGQTWALRPKRRRSTGTRLENRASRAPHK